MGEKVELLFVCTCPDKNLPSLYLSPSLQLSLSVFSVSRFYWHEKHTLPKHIEVKKNLLFLPPSLPPSLPLPPSLVIACRAAQHETNLQALPALMITWLPTEMRIDDRARNAELLLFCCCIPPRIGIHRSYCTVPLPYL